MRVDELSPAPGASKAGYRVGRGTRGKRGKTAGRGTKGQRARGSVKPGFEGGQMPMKQRVPKLKGFKNPFRVEYHAINLDTLSELEETRVDPEVLIAHGLLRKGQFVKILGRGQLTRKVEVHAHGVSNAAETAITAAGGTVTIVPLPFKSGRRPPQGNQFTNR